MKSNLIPDFILENFIKNKYKGRIPVYSVFMDISGFSSLTEVLMKKGTEGSEILADILGNIFKPVVDNIYTYGGFITNFLGDALIALFDSDNTGSSQILSCIWKIKEDLSQIKTQRTNFGNYEINFKTGIAKGYADWAVTGKDNMAYYFKGDSIQLSTQAQNLAKSSEIIFHENISGEIDNSEIISEKINDNFCKLISITNLSDPAFKKRKSITGISSMLFTKKFLPQSIIDFKGKGEFRDVVSVFLTSEEVDEHSMNYLFESVIDAVNKFSGYLQSIEFSDKGLVILICFGAPEYHQDDSFRAMNILNEIFENAAGMRLKAGVTKGKCFAGMTGTHERAQYTILGSSVNLGARLLGEANPGNIIVSKKVFEELKNNFNFKMLNPKILKGFESEKTFYRLISETEFSRKASASEISTVYSLQTGIMIGRGKELNVIYEKVSEVFSEKPSGIILINGEAGIGKSRLISELKKKLFELHGENFQWFECNCNEITIKSLYPFTNAIKNIIKINERQSDDEKKKFFDDYLETLISNLKKSGFEDKEFIEVIESELKRIRSILGSLLDLRWEDSLYEKLEPKMRFENFQLSMYYFILAHALIKPVIIVIEDLHWMDEDSLKFAELLVKNSVDFPVSVIISTRAFESEENLNKIISSVSKDFITSVDLDYLKGDSLDEMAVQILNYPVAEEVKEFIFEKTNGNPYFVEQLFLYLNETNSVILQTDHNGKIFFTFSPNEKKLKDIPAGIKGILLSRLDKLTGDVKEVVQTASVLGREFEVNILIQILKDDDNIETKLKTIEQKKIWYLLNEVKYMFKHSLLRDAAYEMILKSKQRELHLLAADSIEKIYGKGMNITLKEEFAFHFGIGSNFIDDKGRLKLTKESVDLNFSGKNIEKFISVVRETCDYCISEFKNKDALEKMDILLSISEITGDRKLRIDMLNKKYSVSLLTAALDDAIGYCREAVRLSEEITDNERIIRSAINLGSILSMTGKFEESILYISRAIQLAEMTGNKELILYSNNVLARYYDHRFNYEEGLEQYLKLTEMSRTLGIPQEVAKSLNNTGVIYFHRGDIEKAIGYFSQCLEIAKKYNFREQVMNSSGNLAIAEIMRNNFNNGMEYLQTAISIAEEIGDIKTISLATINLANAKLKMKDYDEAENLTMKAIRLEDRFKVNFNRSLAYGNLMGIELEKKRYDKAEDYCMSALKYAEETNNKLRKAEAFMFMGTLNRIKKNYDLSEKYLLDSQKLFEDIGDRTYKVENHNQFGMLYLEKGDYKKAKQYFLSAESLTDKIHEMKDFLKFESCLIKINLKTGDTECLKDRIQTCLENSKSINETGLIKEFELLKKELEETQ